MEEQTNPKRAARAKQLIELYNYLSSTADEIDEDIVTDIFADLLHYCRNNHVDIEKSVEMALSHFREEVREEELDSQEGDRIL